jgi:NADP-dependent 3-hydroxy acid dehydrogenase YdfG
MFLTSNYNRVWMITGASRGLGLSIADAATLLVFLTDSIPLIALQMIELLPQTFDNCH